MLEHIPGLPDLILFWMNDASVIRVSRCEITRGTLSGKHVLTLIWMIMTGDSFKIVSNLAVLTPAKKEEAAAQVGLTETAQRAVSDAEHALLFAGFAAPPALAGWPRRPASLLRAEMRRIAGMRRGFANGLAAKPAPLASLATNYRAKHRQLHPLPTTPSCHVLMPHPSNGLLFFEYPSKV